MASRLVELVDETASPQFSEPTAVLISVYIFKPKTHNVL